MYDIQAKDYGYDIICTGEIHLPDLASLYVDIRNAGVDGSCIVLDMGAVEKFCDCLENGLSMFQENIFDDGVNKLIIVLGDRSKVNVVNFGLKIGDLHDKLKFAHKDDNVPALCKTWFPKLPQEIQVRNNQDNW